MRAGGLVPNSATLTQVMRICFKPVCPFCGDVACCVLEGDDDSIIFACAKHQSILSQYPGHLMSVGPVEELKPCPACKGIKQSWGVQSRPTRIVVSCMDLACPTRQPWAEVSCPQLDLADWQDWPANRPAIAPFPPGTSVYYDSEFSHSFWSIGIHMDEAEFDRQVQAHVLEQYADVYQPLSEWMEALEPLEHVYVRPRPYAVEHRFELVPEAAKDFPFVVPATRKVCEV